MLTKGQRTRTAILDRATALASAEGLESLSIGRLADETGMSKSGLFAHFGSKEELQLAAVDYAAEIFVREVIEPARAAPKGVARVWALCDRMLSYTEREVFPGGCFFYNTSREYKHRPGRVRDRIEERLGQWRSYLQHAIEDAQKLGELDPSVDAARLAFELNSLSVASDSDYQFSGDRRVFDFARDAIRERLESLRPGAARRRRPQDAGLRPASV